MKLGLYGGAFNPIHRCHLVVADAVHSRLGLDTVLFIPTGDPPHKLSSEFFPATHRMEMVKLAITPYPYFQASDIEFRRSAKSYSIDTVRELKKVSPPDTEFVFIIGLDAFLELPTWKDPEALLASCDFAVVSRPGTQFKALEKCAFLAAPDLTLLDALDAAVGSGGGSSRTGPPPARDDSGGESSRVPALRVEGLSPAIDDSGGGSSRTGPPPARDDSGGESSRVPALRVEGLSPARDDSGGGSSTTGPPPARDDSGGESSRVPALRVEGPSPALDDSGGGSSRVPALLTVGRLPLTSGRTLWAIPISPCEVAAKDIRERLRKRQDLENSLPAPVESYILRMNLTDQ